MPSLKRMPSSNLDVAQMPASVEIRHCLSTDVHQCPGDTGGNLGLLIGGSALTVLELFDLFVYNAYLKCAASQRPLH